MYKGTNIKREINPKEKASWFSMILYLFTFEIFKKSAKRELQEEDVYQVIDELRSAQLGDAVETAWEYQRRKPKVSLTSVIFRVFGRRYMLFGVANCFVRVALIIVQPLATGKLVSYFSPSTELTSTDAYMYASIIVFCTAFLATWNHFYMYHMQQIGLMIRISLCSLVYRKSLKLTSSSLIDFTGGKIVTMISRDVLVFESALIFAHDLWIGCIQIFVMMYIMYQQIQISAVAGIGVLIMLIPLQAWISVKTMYERLKASAKTDQRLRSIQEILTSIKLIKLYTWEKFYTDIVGVLRKIEMRRLRKIFYLKIMVLIISVLSQRFSLYVCVVLYVLLGNTITAEKVFVVISCYGALRFVLTVSIPMSVAQAAEAKSALKRIKSFLLIEDITSIQKVDLIVKETKIFVKNASVRILNTTVLKNVNFEAKKSLIGVTGPVGSGKSTFLKLILQDMRLVDGHVRTSGGISYASQEPWLFPGTIRQNILFGLDYEKERYQTVVKACALTRDLQHFPDRDNTIVGDKGLNLSKGQQARINLARAIYKKCDIYLLDDVIAALDASVSKYVFENCFRGFLKDKLVITICHNKKFLAEMDRIVIIDHYGIYADDKYANLEARGIDFGMHQSLESAVTDEITNPEKKANEEENADEYYKLLVSTDRDLDNAAIYGEFKQEGQVTWEVYKNYFYYAGGWKLLPLYLLVCIVTQFTLSYFDYYITLWLRIEQNLSYLKMDNSTTQEQLDEAISDHKNSMFIYTMIILATVVLASLRLFYFFYITTMASTKLHNKIFATITAAKMAFFDTHLSGNILNRFSKDFVIIDEMMPRAYLEFIRILFVLVGAIIVIAIVNWTLLIPTAVALTFMFILRYLFIKTSRTLKRLDGITRSPVIGYLNSSLDGLTTIRAFGNEIVLTSQFDGHQDLNSSATYMFLATSRAFGFWLDMLCAVFIGCVTFSFIIFKSAAEDGNVGLAITQAFSLTGLLQWGIRNWTDVETFMTSVERVLEYDEAEPENLGGQDPDNWPTKGKIEYKDVCLKYTNSETYVLQKVNFVIKPSEKVGIIGRTGAGKSSIISVLFRLYEVEGAIIIDDTNIRDIQLHTVRSQISIIPQDPVLFAGTIRTNLDPHDEHTDLELWNSLGEVELRHVVENFEMGLKSTVSDGGANFSVGQRQLICLARAVLRNNKILVLDEATANIDPQTDELIQKTIKRIFADCTILTVAHRLNTIIDSDKIMVVDFGTIVEFDTPQNLLDKRQGIFYSLAKQAGICN